MAETKKITIGNLSPKRLPEHFKEHVTELIKPNNYSVRERIEMLAELAEWASERVKHLREGDRAAQIVVRLQAVEEAVAEVEKRLPALESARDELLVEIREAMGDADDVASEARLKEVSVIALATDYLRNAAANMRKRFEKQVPDVVDRLANASSGAEAEVTPF